ncbi:MAG: acyltransferase [Chitinophagaceae bacterium]|nr:acyltransferase [Chitinophagaceae bacterium]
MGYPGQIHQPENSGNWGILHYPTLKSHPLQTFAITHTNHKNLDGLRAIGILMVMVQHYYAAFIPVSALWTSIDLLFALSGLLITGILIETKEDPGYFRKFYMRRILRIFPLYYLLIGLFSLYVYFISVNPSAFTYFKSNIICFLTYTRNGYFIHAGVPPAGHINHTWSLAIDEQIYLAWPFLIWLCRNKRQLLILCGFTFIFSLVFRILYNQHIDASGSLHPYPYFHNTFSRLDAFASGAFLYCLLRFVPQQLSNRKATAILVLTLIAFIACGLADHSFERRGYFMRNFGCSIAGIHFCTWLYFAVKKNNPLVNFICSSRWLVYTGKISYSLYVFHWFLLILLLPRISNLLTSLTGYTSSFVSVSLCFLATFLISALSYAYFEKPFMNLKRKFNYR